MNMVRTAVILLILMFFSITVLGQTTWHVDDDNCEGPGSGTPEDPYCTIQDAIDAASDGDNVIVENGVYKGEGNRDIRFYGKAITVKSKNGPATCVIDAEGTSEEHHNGFYLEEGDGPDSIIQGFTIQNGYHIYGGGLWLGWQAAPKILNNIIIDNTAVYCGGGIYCDDSYSSALIMNNIIARNIALLNSGGGIHCDFSYPLIINNTIVDNSSVYAGGGIACGGLVEVNVENCILWNNSAPNGNEIYIGWSTHPADLYISYSDVEGGASGVYYAGGNLHWGLGMIDIDPLFCSGPGGDYYLSHIDAGQSINSPCIDAGNEMAYSVCADTGLETFCMDQLTTRNDHQVGDLSLVDLGYHYSLTGFTTISAEMNCTPVTGTLPFEVLMTVNISNVRSDQTRQIAGRVDVDLAGGVYISNFRSGYTNLPPSDSLVYSWNQTLPPIGKLVGLSEFLLYAEDVTPSPYNQPPYLPSGFVEGDSCALICSQPPPTTLALYAVEVDDDNIGPSSGNGDNQVNPGETIQLHIVLENTGSSTAYGVETHLSCSNTNISIVDPEANYGDIYPGEMRGNLDEILLEVALTATDKETATINIVIRDSFQMWGREYEIPITGPVVKYESHVVSDMPIGNNDGDADMNESPYLELTLLNQGDINVSGVSASLNALETDYVTVLDSIADFSDMSSGESSVSSGPHYQVHIDSSVPCGRILSFELTVDSDQGRTYSEFTLRVGGPGGGLCDDIEEGESDWEHYASLGSDDWETVFSSYAHSPTEVWFCSDVDNIKDDYLISPPLVMAETSQMSFWHRYDMESGYDGCVIEISTDGGSSWYDLGGLITQGGYNSTISAYYQSPIGGRQAWSGNSGAEMEEVVVDLSSFDGLDALIRFRLASDSSVGCDGWYVDDVEVTGTGCQIY